MQFKTDESVQKTGFKFTAKIIRGSLWTTVNIPFKNTDALGIRSRLRTKLHGNSRTIAIGPDKCL